ncbi:Glycosyltransferase [Heracleum sosnowskyi]|uniref:Glycosyltransferase n=1 Tax=Heracleum sosnowskyi TaxID=360622 RepID=A0AAD8JFY2_9APIA|nr:Glycosyltransferase [Heracleum sosnowskyi]
MAEQRHILLITFPAQGHINPSLQFAKKLTRMGVQVTFATSLSAHSRMANTLAATKGLNIASFSDGYDDGFKLTDDAKHFMSSIRNHGSESVKQILRSTSEKGSPISCVVYTLLLPWVADVARQLGVPSALLWIQPASVLDIYYYYFNGYGEAMNNCLDDPAWSIQLPGLPLLHARDLPSFILPTCHEMYSFALPSFKEQLDALNADEKPMVLVNSFDALEVDALKAIEKLELIAIGPVLPSAFLDGKDPSDTSFGGDLFQKSRNYKDWLDSKPHNSVIYISFGSILTLSKPQMNEIGKGLLKSGRPFLWVIRKKEGESEEEKVSCVEELEEQGMIVPWCSQLEVLSHPALGCFVTHCGWNSTLESLVSRVPVVAFPHWTDQTTNAKLIEDAWKTGVRVNSNEGGVVDGDEVKRCIEMVMGDEELRNNAKKWGDLAREAISEGGSSDKNLKAFVEHVDHQIC